MGSWIFRIITGHSEYSRISPGTSFVQWERARVVDPMYSDAQRTQLNL